jgi:hypothetical protein
VIIDWPNGFDQYLDRLEGTAAAGAAGLVFVLDRILAELAVLQDLDGEPVEETATLKQAHPFHVEVAVRLIVWFPPGDPGTVVVALFAGDKARMGAVFYDSVGARADAAIGQWLFQQQKEK